MPTSSKDKLIATYEELHKINGSLPCSSYKCTLCEPGGDNDASVVTLPWEHLVVERKLGFDPGFEIVEIEPGVTVGIVREGKFCNHFSCNQCHIYEARPVDCRSCPLLPTRVTGELSFFIDPSCKINHYLSWLRMHVKRWTQIWLQIDPLIPASWWDLYDHHRPIPVTAQILDADEIIAKFRAETTVPVFENL